MKTVLTVLAVVVCPMSVFGADRVEYRTRMVTQCVNGVCTDVFQEYPVVVSSDAIPIEIKKSEIAVKSSGCGCGNPDCTGKESTVLFPRIRSVVSEIQNRPRLFNGRFVAAWYTFRSWRNR